ncbi:hypothetical protein HAX54_018416 [Datura stramonium]|uniref:Uncharacterized protein n=1 Tax=Datura stramonium TaxID=4076 RepID=A0ABS8S214_DATST|nr:hypothetical protein [Datura stramonium]
MGSFISFLIFECELSVVVASFFSREVVHLFAKADIMEMLGSWYPESQVLGSTGHKNVSKLLPINVPKASAFAIATPVLPLGDQPNHSSESPSFKSTLINVFPVPVKNSEKKNTIPISVYKEVHMLSRPVTVTS